MVKSLLIVTASVLTSGLLVRLLSSIPGVASVTTASSTDEALAVLAGQRPTMIVADIARHSEPGLATLTSLLAAAPGSRIAVLIDEADAIVQKKCLQLGASWVFDKSTEFERLLELVRASP